MLDIYDMLFLPFGSSVDYYLKAGYKHFNIPSDVEVRLEAARVLGLNRITIWRWIKQGKLHTQSVGGVVFIPKKEEIDLIQTLRTKRRAN